jgi:hypothetical protein
MGVAKQIDEPMDIVFIGDSIMISLGDMFDSMCFERQLRCAMCASTVGNFHAIFGLPNYWGNHEDLLMERKAKFAIWKPRKIVFTGLWVSWYYVLKTHPVSRYAEPFDAYNGDLSESMFQRDGLFPEYLETMDYYMSVADEVVGLSGFPTMNITVHVGNFESSKFPNDDYWHRGMEPARHKNTRLAIERPLFNYSLAVGNFTRFRMMSIRRWLTNPDNTVHVFDPASGYSLYNDYASHVSEYLFPYIRAPLEYAIFNYTDDLCDPSLLLDADWQSGIPVESLPPGLFMGNEDFYRI